tara:strand:+ start:493 stop:1260 length:768 start_codon:yes stop_codon:yes gene_type:complete
MQDVSPYKVLDIKKNCTLDELKSKFKHLAVKYHPDKGGDRYIFNMMVECYKKIYRDIQAKDGDKLHVDLKHDARRSLNPKENSYVVANDGFADKFNRYFDENKTRDENVDRGYQSFIKDSDVKTSDKHYKLKKYKEPEGSVQSKLHFHELGEKMRDFSGKNDDMHKLQYMDYQYAHTTSKLIEPSLVQERQEYKNLEDITKKRASTNYDLTDKDKKYYENIQYRKDKREQKRISNLTKYNQYLESHNRNMKNLIA